MFGNLLNTAMRVIPKQTVSYYKFKSRKTNDYGQDVSEYEEPIDVIGSCQATSRSHIQLLGLDLDREYITFYCSKDVLDMERETSGDQLQYGGTRYQVLDKSDWIRQDGWNGVVCVRIYARE